jgi:CheY-like chemotaxis protein
VKAGCLFIVLYCRIVLLVERNAINIDVLNSCEQLILVKKRIKMLKLCHPFTMLVTGPTQSGKTVFVLKIISQVDRLIDPAPKRILYCYTEYQPKSFDAFAARGVNFFKGIPSLEMFDGSTPTLLVLDDMMEQLDENISMLFTRVSHHRDLSVIFLSQNMFPKNPHARTISLNAHYMVLFKSPRDVNQFAVLARQMFSSNYKFAVEAFEDATSEAHGYLLVDMKPQTEDRLRLRTKIFPDEQTYVYVDSRLYKPDGW